MVLRKTCKLLTLLLSEGGDTSSYNDVDSELYVSDSIDDYDGPMTFTQALLLSYPKGGKVPTFIVYC